MVKNEILDIVDMTLFFSFILDSELRWNSQMTRLAKRLSPGAYAVERIRRLTDESTARVGSRGDPERLPQRVPWVNGLPPHCSDTSGELIFHRAGGATVDVDLWQCNRLDRDPSGNGSVLVIRCPSDTVLRFSSLSGRPPRAPTCHLLNRPPDDRCGGGVWGESQIYKSMPFNRPTLCLFTSDTARGAPQPAAHRGHVATFELTRRYSISAEADDNLSRVVVAVAGRGLNKARESFYVRRPFVGSLIPFRYQFNSDCTVADEACPASFLLLDIGRARTLSPPRRPTRGGGWYDSCHRCDDDVRD
ncbi:hypothetical protein EVAR_824_1 [Eumeta japonica]|uniref:Uncharacterized protein n=1 Tax=Eumeta variegata TaxID=151549 RepID=A0A4C1SDE4_EUMVA|nr:hypothetical protein EVAR_824_1 [Eumeta japonica]